MRAPLNRQSGTAILLAILVVAITTIIASAILSEYGQSVSHLSGRHDQAQSRWLANGAVDWARSVLEADARRANDKGVDHEQEDWAVKVAPTQLEEGEVGGQIFDMSGRFNVNSLVQAGVVNPGQTQIFIRLLGNLGVGQGQAQVLANTLSAWLGAKEMQVPIRDGQTYAALNNSLLDVNELLHVPGFNADTVALLRPFVSTLISTQTTINVNTASPEVMAAYGSNLSVSQAKSLIFERQRSHFNNVNQFTDLLPQGAGMETSLLTVSSRFFLVIGRARWGQSVTQMEVLLDRKQNRPDIVWKKIT